VDRLMTLRRVAHASPIAISLLVAANCVPLAGVLLLGWDLPTLVALYWLENGVVGLFALGRILTAQGQVVSLPSAASPMTRPGGPPPPPPPPPLFSRGLIEPGAGSLLARLMLAPFFVVHYGTFWLVHGVFVWLVLPSLFADAGAPPSQPDVPVVMLAGIAMVISHGASFLFNWLGAGEYRTASPAAEMAAPYLRVVVLHLTILFGAFAVAVLGAPVWALVVMVGVKTFADLSAHLAERQRAAARMGTA
jgi:hypothetical protein